MDRARQLQRAYEIHNISVIDIGRVDLAASLRADPRFIELLKQIGLRK